MKKTPKVDEYDPMIYPRMFWVSTELEGLDKIFDFMSTVDLGKVNNSSYDSLLNDWEFESAGMVTVPVIRKSDNMIGVLVIALDMNGITPDMVPHEAVHVADYYYESLGLSACSFAENEAYAYLAGWAGGCLSKSISNRIKENVG